MVRGARPGSRSNFRNQILPLFVAQNSLACIEFLRSIDLLSNSEHCARCFKRMSTVIAKDRLDNCTWYCRRCRTKRSVRSGSFFEQHRRIPLGHILHYIYNWTQRMTAGTSVNEDLATDKPLKKLADHLTSVCVISLGGIKPLKVGGPGLVVQADESAFSKRKYNRGRVMHTRWVLGMVDTSHSPARPILQLVPQRTAATLCGIISYHVNAGCSIHTDEWRSYRQLPATYAHHTVNHSRYFVNPRTGVHTNHVESMWRKCKAFLAGHKYRTDTDLQTWLDVFMWSEWLAKDWPGGPFLCLLNDIKSQYLVQ